jgi:uncharacterized Rossmann fold enzyme
MEFSEWLPIYNQILKDFKFSRESDEASAELLKEVLRSKNIITIDELGKLIAGKVVYVFGAGPELDIDIKNVFENTNGDFVTIAADGATSAFIKLGKYPDIIVSDLDGYMPHQLKANKSGSILLIHAHGDNVQALKEWVPMVEGKVLGTTQAQPDIKANVHNFGGFTDGDRAAFLAAHFKAKRINLVSFNFREIGKYSFKYNSKTKLRKLTWANLLIGMIRDTNVQFLPLGSD